MHLKKWSTNARRFLLFWARFSCGKEARRHCGCWGDLWSGRGDSRGGPGARVRSLEGEVFRNCWLLEHRQCCYSCQEHLHFKEGCLGGIAGSLQGERRCILGRRRLLWLLAVTCLSARALLFTLQKLPRSLGGLGPIILQGFFLEECSASRIATAWGGNFLGEGRPLSQGGSLTYGNRLQGNWRLLPWPFLLPRPFPTRLEGDSPCRAETSCPLLPTSVGTCEITVCLKSLNERSDR